MKSTFSVFYLYLAPPIIGSASAPEQRKQCQRQCRRFCHPVELAFYRTGSHLVRIGIAVPLSQRRARVIVRRLLRCNDEYDEYAKDA